MKYTDAWREKLRKALSERGRRSDLARWLVRELGGELASRKVQVARVLNAGTMPDAEFVLATDVWLQKQKRGRNT